MAVGRMFPCLQDPSFCCRMSMARVFACLQDPSFCCRMSMTRVFACLTGSFLMLQDVHDASVCLSYRIFPSVAGCPWRECLLVLQDLSFCCRMSMTRVFPCLQDPSFCCRMSMARVFACLTGSFLLLQDVE